MINQEEKLILNGYGTIGVGIKGADSNILIVDYIDPKQIVGDAINMKEVEVLHRLELSLSAMDWSRLLIELDEIKDKENKVIHVAGWVIDFNNYNHLSVNVWRKKLMQMNIFTAMLAC